MRRRRQQGTGAVFVALLLAGCVRPAEDRADADFGVGVGEAGGATFTVAGGLASVRSIERGKLVLWAQAPVLSIDVALAPGATAVWDITLLNAMPAAELTSAEATGVTDGGGPRPTVKIWTVTFDATTDAATIEIGPPDWRMIDPFRFAYMTDIQTGIDTVTDLYDRMNTDPDIRFVIAGGDLVERGDRDELVLVQEMLQVLDVPFFSTNGNHELWASDSDWEQLVGVRNFHFVFKGAHFSFADSASATLDPSVYDRLEPWLEQARDEVHVFATHYPPFDPIGIREGGFRSRKEAAKLYSMLAAGNVDALFCGHIHSFYAYEVAGVPTYISGGGGADPQEKLDGIGRHYLTVDANPALLRLDDVGIVRIED